PNRLLHASRECDSRPPSPLRPLTSSSEELFKCFPREAWLLAREHEWTGILTGHNRRLHSLALVNRNFVLSSAPFPVVVQIIFYFQTTTTGSPGETCTFLLGSCLSRCTA